MNPQIRLIDIPEKSRHGWVVPFISGELTLAGVLTRRTYGYERTGRLQ